jgi:hypothetical protein
MGFAITLVGNSDLVSILVLAGWTGIGTIDAAFTGWGFALTGVGWVAIARGGKFIT